MVTPNKEEFLEKIRLLREKYLATKACFAYLGPDAIGQKGPFTAPFYAELGFPVMVLFDAPLTPEKRDKLNRCGHFLNQSVIVLLWAIIDEANNKLSDGKIDQTKPEQARIRILRSLRNQITHDFGTYDPSNDDEKKLMDLLKSEFDVENDLPEFPVPVDKVVKPLFYSCEKYLNSF